jgi:hypothetical protein
MTQEISPQDISKIIADGDAVVLVTQSKAFGEAIQVAGLTSMTFAQS